MKQTPPLHSSIIQPQIHWEDKKGSIRHIESLLQDVNSHTHIVILPEMFATGFSMNTSLLAEEMDGPTIRWMRDTAQSLRKIITGSVIIHEDGRFYNRLIWMMPTGAFYHYDKVHLFSKAGEEKHFMRGEKKLMVSVNGWRILLSICYDLRFPVWNRQGSDLYDILINVAQWPAIRSDAYQALLKARAIENQCYVLAANSYGADGQNIPYSGHSAAYNYDGTVITEMTGQAGVRNISMCYEDMAVFRKQNPFLNDRDHFIILNDNGE